LHEVGVDIARGASAEWTICFSCRDRDVDFRKISNNFFTSLSFYNTYYLVFFPLQHMSIHLNHNKFVFHNTCFTIDCTIKNLITQ
jgi:hypothetical protein